MDATRALGLVAVAAALVVILPSAARAYIDPGAGSLFTQVVVAVFVAAAGALKFYWRRLKDLASRLGGAPKNDPGA